MLKKRFTNVNDVTQWRLCLGCGACVPACPEKAISLVDVRDKGIRPIINPTKCRKCGECLKVCPGIEISHKSSDTHTITDLDLSWGPVLEVWEGYATDPEIRYKGSSGGAATALALYCLEKEHASGVLHIGTQPQSPLNNIAVFSKTREELAARTGSRYSPAAPCERLDYIRDNPGSYVFVGKPCDVVALRKSQEQNQSLKDNVLLSISIFCAGTPSTEGTYSILDKLNLKADQVEELRYRGCGWPGTTCVKTKDVQDKIHQISYEQSWGDILSRYTQFRCRLCPDSTGEFADISCGDPWYRQIKPGEPGWSLVLVRTEQGRKILNKAVKDGYLKLNPVDPETVPNSQKALLTRRRHLWGRLLVLHTMLVPVPKYVGFHLWKNWWHLTTIEKLRSLGGTLKRLFRRGWFRCLNPIDLNNPPQTEISRLNPDKNQSQCKA
jgi:coenzyme F420 hydrogenase subunit beta